jgi:transcriptional regulator with XRE-family HTH domain
MVTIPQIKAARALLGWTQRDLARISGLSLASVAQIESGAGKPRAATLNILQKAFEKYDIEFSDDPGVRIRCEPLDVSIWQGLKALLRVWDDIEQTFGDGKGGEVLLSAVDHDLWDKLLPGHISPMFKRRQKLKIATRGLVVRQEDSRAKQNENYRYVAPEVISADAPFYIYSDKIALVKMTEPVRVVLIQNRTIADSFRKLFLYLWKTGK